MYYRQRIRDFNLISQKHWKRNGNLIHCSQEGRGGEGRGVSRGGGTGGLGGDGQEGEREGAKGRQAGEKFTSTLG